ncbi:MAG: DNA-binding transcriptional LysR family regulator [Candidatus Azotimanducaceae bacterium]|jgi:DNA-binding transcriptional LysR family regulator
MDRIHQLEVFVAVAEEQGFAAAARRLQISPPAVTRMVAALEDTLGVQLLIRTTRSVRVTDAGRQYLGDAKQILESVQAADDAVSGINAAPRGKINITAPVLFGRKHVMPVLVDYLNAYSDTEVETLFVDRVVNLVEEGLDVGIRIGGLVDSSLRAIHVGEVRSTLIASPDYLALTGHPRSPDDLKNHTVITSTAGEFSLSWRFLEDTERLVRVNPRLMSSTNDAAIEAAVLGFGIARVISYQVADELKSGALVRLMEAYEPAATPVHIVHREGRYATFRIRTLIDLLAERLRQTLDYEEGRRPHRSM